MAGQNVTSEGFESKCSEDVARTAFEQIHVAIDHALVFHKVDLDVVRTLALIQALVMRAEEQFAEYDPASAEARG